MRRDQQVTVGHVAVGADEGGALPVAGEPFLFLVLG
jgi:hypothetical protein